MLVFLDDQSKDRTAKTGFECNSYLPNGVLSTPNLIFYFIAIIVLKMHLSSDFIADFIVKCCENVTPTSYSNVDYLENNFLLTL